MGKLIAIHWDQKQLLVATAQRAAGGLWIDRVEVIDVSQDESPDRIHKALKKAGITRGEATVVIGRSGVEMRQLDVPPVPAEELPGLVRFQAKSSFASLADDWALDFVPIAENGHVETVLATALSNERINEIKAQVEPCGLKVRHIVIRPFSTVELARTSKAGSGCCIIVNHFETEVDITVSKNGYVNLSRSIRITPPEDEVSDIESYSAKIIIQELRRTLAAASNQSDAVKVDRIVLCGHLENHSALAEMIDSELSLPVEPFHPFEKVRVRPAAKQRLPSTDGRFSPLLGSLVQQDSADHHAIDLLNPRKAETGADQRRKKILIGALAATVLLLAVGYCFFSLRSMNQQIANLESEEASLLQSNQGVDSILTEVGAIDDWTRGDIVWIDELAEVSDRYLYPDDVRARRFSGSVVNNRATINTSGVALDAATNSQLKQKLEELYNIDERTAKYIDPKDGDDNFIFDYLHVLHLDIAGRPLFINKIIRPEIPIEQTETSESSDPEEDGEAEKQDKTALELNQVQEEGEHDA